MVIPVKSLKELKTKEEFAAYLEARDAAEEILKLRSVFTGRELEGMVSEVVHAPPNFARREELCGKTDGELRKLAGVETQNAESADAGKKAAQPAGEDLTEEARLAERYARAREAKVSAFALVLAHARALGETDGRTEFIRVLAGATDVTRKEDSRNESALNNLRILLKEGCTLPEVEMWLFEKRPDMNPYYLARNVNELESVFGRGQYGLVPVAPAGAEADVEVLTRLAEKNPRALLEKVAANEDLDGISDARLREIAREALEGAIRRLPPAERGMLAGIQEALVNTIDREELKLRLGEARTWEECRQRNCRKRFAG